MRAKVTVKKLPKDSMMNLHDELGRGKIGDQEVRFVNISTVRVSGCL